MIGVVVLQNSSELDALGFQRPGAAAVNVSPRRVRRAVRAVGADGEHTDLFQTPDTVCGGKRKLLVPPAEAMAREAHNSLAARDIGELFAVPGVTARDVREENTGVARGAGEPIRQQDRAIAQLPADPIRGSAELPHAARHDALHIIERLRGLLFETGERRRREPELILPRDAQRVLACAAVRIGGAGGDGVQRIAQHVREDHRIDPRRGAKLRELPSLDGGKPLADHVHLRDVRAACEQLARDILKLLLADQRTLEERGASAGDQKKHRVPLRKRRDQLDYLAGGGVGIAVGHGVPGLKDPQLADRAFGVLILGDHDAVRDGAGERGMGSGSHLPGGLADGDQMDAFPAEIDLRKRAADGLIRQRVLQGAAIDLFGVRAQ